MLFLFLSDQSIGFGEDLLYRRLGDQFNFDRQISCKHMNLNAGYMVVDEVPFDRYKSVGCWKQYYRCQRMLGLGDLPIGPIGLGRP